MVCMKIVVVDVAVAVFYEVDAVVVVSDVVVADVGVCSLVVDAVGVVLDGAVCYAVFMPLYGNAYAVSCSGEDGVVAVEGDAFSLYGNALVEGVGAGAEDYVFGDGHTVMRRNAEGGGGCSGDVSWPLVHDAYGAEDEEGHKEGEMVRVVSRG